MRERLSANSFSMSWNLAVLLFGHIRNHLVNREIIREVTTLHPEVMVPKDLMRKMHTLLRGDGLLVLDPLHHQVQDTGVIVLITIPMVVATVSFKISSDINNTAERSNERLIS